MESQPFHLATLLGPRNIQLARELGFGSLVRRYFRLPLGIKAQKLYEMIASEGGGQAALHAMRGVDRHRFVATRQRHLAYLDASMKVRSFCYLTAPSLVGVMLDMAGPVEGAGVVMELGAGTGFHAQCIKRLLAPRLMLSVELDANVNAARSIARKRGLNPAEVIRPAAAAASLPQVEYLYATVALRSDEVDDLCSRLPASALVTVPRQMTKEEFFLSRPRSVSDDSYSTYVGSPNWNHNVVLETRVAGSGRQLSAYYGVRFMRAVADGHIICEQGGRGSPRRTSPSRSMANSR